MQEGLKFILVVMDNSQMPIDLCITPEVREQLAFSLIKRAQIPKQQYAKMILKLKKCASRVQNHWFCLILGSCVPISYLI